MTKVIQEKLKELQLALNLKSNLTAKEKRLQETLKKKSLFEFHLALTIINFLILIISIIITILF